MTNKETLKKQIIYRSTHRGTKEMDILLGTFVKKHLDEFSNDTDLKNLEKLLLIEDEILYQCYNQKKGNNKVPDNKVFHRFINFKI